MNVHTNRSKVELLFDNKRVPKPWQMSRSMTKPYLLLEFNGARCHRPLIGGKKLTRSSHIPWKIEIKFEPRHDKANRMTVHPAKTQISLGIRPVWAESSLSAWRKLGFLATHQAHSKDSDQTGRMPRLIWVFAGRTLVLLVLSCQGSIVQKAKGWSNSTFGHVNFF